MRTLIQITSAVFVFSGFLWQFSPEYLLAGEPRKVWGRPDLAHPLIAESPTPDTELRFEYITIDKPNGDEQIVNPEGEFALSSWASIEVDLPYTFRQPSSGTGSTDHLANTEIALKLAHGLTEDILVGGGLELGIPTGDDAKGIGSNNEIVITPFLGFGARFGGFEVITFLGFGVPFNEGDPEARAEKDLELEYNLALAYWFVPRTRLILEFDGEAVVLGNDNQGTINVTVGGIGAPLRNWPLEIGGGVSIPLTADKEFDSRLIVSALYQF